MQHWSYPSDLFNCIPQGGGLEKHPQRPNLTDNGVLMVYLLARSSVVLRLINQTFVYERNRSVGTGKRIVPFTSPD